MHTLLGSHRAGDLFARPFLTPTSPCGLFREVGAAELKQYKLG